MTGCLGDVAAALVDGELDHAARERAQRHLAHCAACRAQVDDQRRLKARLAALGEPVVPDRLTARLLSLGAAEPRPPLPWGSPGRPVPVRTPARARAGARPAGRPRRGRALRRRAAAGSALAALGVAAAVALGGPPSRPPSTPVDPATDAFVTQFVDTTSGTGGGGATSASLTSGSAGDRR